jgi:hypothetical protein
LFDRKKDSIKWSKRNEEHIHYDHVESRYHIWIKISPNVTIFKDSTDKVFSKTFTTAGEKLPLELIVGRDTNETRVYGPDFSSTRAYHVEAPFLKGNAHYTIRAEIAAINAKHPQNKITDQFTLRTVT